MAHEHESDQQSSIPQAESAVPDALPVQPESVADDVPAAEVVEDAIAFDVPAPTGDPGSFTMGMALADLPADLAELAGLPPTADPPSGIPPVPVAALTPLAEAPVVAEDELVPLAAEVPVADPASSTTLATAVDPPSGVNLTANSSTRLAQLAEAVPEAAAVAEAIPEATAAGDSSVLGNLEPILPVQPASGWFDDHAADAHAISEGDSLPTAQPISGADAVAESSDIFAGGSVPMAGAVDPADVSDVITATAGPPLGSLSAMKPHRAPESPGRSSDVALTFDSPPGGSTVADPNADAGLPVAGEVEEPIVAAEWIEDVAEDSATLARTPPLPDARSEDADLGVVPPLLPDASSILAELSGQPDYPYEDSSAIRLEAPGIERTLADDSLGDAELVDEADLTLPDAPLPHAVEPTATAKPGLVRGDSVSDVDLGRVERGRPFEEELSASHIGGQSSIFSDLKDPGAMPTGGSGDVPIADPDLTDAVDFSDHPDLAGADSDSFHRGIEPPTAAELAMAAEADADEGMIDWDAAEGHPEATMGLGAAGISSDLFSGPASGILSRGRGQDDFSSAEFEAALAEDPTADMPPPVAAAKSAKPAKGQTPTPVPPSDDSEPSVVVEWMTDSSTERAPLVESKARPTRTPERDRGRPRDEGTDPTRVAPAAARPSSGLGRVLGPVLGLLVGVGASAGVYFSGVLGDTKPTANPSTTAQPPGPTGTGGATTTTGWAQVRTNPKAAIRDLVEAGATTPAAKAQLGEARLLAALRDSASSGTPVNADDLKQARADLEAAAAEADPTPEGEQAAIRATLKLALSYELAGDIPAARKIYTDGITKFPAGKAAFEAALDRLDATTSITSKTSRLTPADAEQLILASNFLTTTTPPANMGEAKADEPAEAGPAFWKAVNAAAKQDYDTAIQKIDEAKKAHVARARALAGQGLNPTSDPLEQIFPRCCDDLKAYWEFRKTTYPKLIAAEKSLEAERTALAEARKELKAEKANAVKLADDLKAEKANAVKLADDLKTEKANAVKLSDDLKKEQELVIKLQGDLKKSDDTVTDLNGKLKKATDDTDTLAKKLKDADAALAASEKARSEVQGTIDTIAKELQAAKVLPAKYDLPTLVASVRGAAKVAANPDLAGAVDRAVKAEAEAKAAKEELTKAQTQAQADIKTLKDTQAAELKTLKDAQAAELKKRDEQVLADRKKAADDLAAETKKLKDAQALELKKQADENAKQVLALQQQIADEKARAAALTKKFETDLGNAVSPSQALDLWLKILMGLRRPADADPALAAAAKVLASAPAGSEDHAKAQTVTGLALLIKGDPAGAKIHFIQAKSTPAYKEAAAAQKPWTQAADVGLATVDDPVAPLRRPVEGPVMDKLLAAKYFDAGVTAYRAGRFTDAEKMLAQAAWHDETNPLTWYFLGAARWQLGKTDQAKADFRQGAEREKQRIMPTRGIDLAISPIQGAARDALTDARR